MVAVGVAELAGGLVREQQPRGRRDGAGEREALARAVPLPFVAPPLALCTDNAAMIGWAAIERARAGILPDAAITARPRWPLDDRATPLLGAGAKGAKA